MTTQISNIDTYKTADANPFQPSGMTRRSPPMGARTALPTPRSVPPKSKSIAKDAYDTEGTPRSTHSKTSGPAEVNQASMDARISSPRQEFILKMRNSEEETVEKCRNVLKKVRHAIAKQRNVSMDVQNSVSELEELLDILGEYRRKWKTAETEKEISRTSLEKTALPENYSQNARSLPQKRVATSPAEKPTPEKRQKEISEKKELKNEGKRDPKECGGKEAPDPLKRKPAAGNKTRKKMPKHRPDAVVIKPAEGNSYADVLKRLKENVRPEEADITVRSIRRTRAGAILLQLAQGGNVEQFSEAIKESLKEAAEVRDMKSKITVEIRDIDCSSTKEDVITAVCKTAETTEGEMTVRLTNPNSRDQRRAFVVLPTNKAKKLLKIERIKIGWINCRVRYQEEDKRCFKCFGLGHGQWECRGPDRKARGLCIKCGEEGHIMKQCRKQPNCCLCTEQGKSQTDHLPGSRSCKADRQS